MKIATLILRQINHQKLEKNIRYSWMDIFSFLFFRNSQQI